MQMIVLPVVGRSDFGKKSCHHFYNVGHRHLADLILRADIGYISTLSP